MPPPFVPPKEVSEILRFVAEKSKNAETPVVIQEMCRQFQTETGSPWSARTLYARIQRFRGRIHQMDEFDMETKARMMMAVNAKVDDGFLKELKEKADVEVDDQNRIIRYGEKGESQAAANLNGPSTSSSAKRRRKPSTSVGKKRIRVDSEVSEVNEESILMEKQTSDHEGPDFQLIEYEKTPRRTEIEQKPVDLFHRMQPSPVNPEHLVECFPGNRTTEVPSTSVRDLLILLRGVLLSLESNHLNGLRRKIESKIEKFSIGGDQEIPLENINLQFDTCLYLLTKHATMNPEEESTSLRNFLCFLHAATCHLVHPSMVSFHQKMKTYLEELEVLDKKIPIKIVHNAMDAILNFIDP